MKKYLSIFTFFLGMAWNDTIQAQETMKIEDDSLSIFLENKDLVSYFRKIAELGDTAFLHNDTGTLLALSKMLQKDFVLSNASQRMKIRWTAAKFGQEIYRLIGNVDESLKLYLIAFKNVQNNITLDSLAWYIENQIMSLYTRKGEYEKAKYFGNLLEASFKHYKQNEFLSRYYVNLGILLESEFKIEMAKEVFVRGYKLADSIKYNLGIFGNVLSLAALYNEYPDLGSSESFLALAGELLPSLESDKRYLEKKASYEIESANYLNLKGKYSESIPLYKKAIETLVKYYPSKERREFAKFYTSLAKAYYKTDSLQNAALNIHLGFATLIPEFKKSDEIPALYQLNPENSFIDLLDLQAQVFQKQISISQTKDALEKAMTCIVLAMDVNDLIRETVIADPSKLVSIRSNRDLIGKGIDILYQLQSADSAQYYYDQVRSLFNRSKSLLFNDKTRKNILAGIISTEDRQRWAALQDTLVNKYESKFEPGANINTINGEILVIQEKIDKIFLGYSDSLLIKQEPDQYIEYVMTDEYVYTFSVLDGQHKFLKIGTMTEYNKLDERLNEFSKQKAMNLDVSVLKDLYSFLVRPLRVRLPGSVVIIPDGRIGYVPFEMLKDDLDRYLIETSTISYAFEYITYQNGMAREIKPLDVFCLAPKYRTKEKKNSEVVRGSIYDLPYAKMEVDSIQHLFGASAQTSQSGDKNDLEQKLNDTNIFHYAGHAIINPDKAYLALNDSGDEKQQLTGSEIGIKHHALDLVVLSACETGLGKMEEGEGIRSLGRSFMESGAGSTVISLWNVNDKSTAMIMTFFYKYLRKKMRKDDALRQAKLDYIHQVPSRLSHPYFWAAFIPAGDMCPLNIR